MMKKDYNSPYFKFVELDENIVKVALSPYTTPTRPDIPIISQSVKEGDVIFETSLSSPDGPFGEIR
ncbi:MAG: hypothetical protein MJZ31_09600 [Bacteroidales bacterium]|nr:hypothetical protein [Bacteroidales bacterium]